MKWMDRERSFWVIGGRPAAAGLGAAAPGGRPHRPHRRAGRRGPGAGAAWPWSGAGALRHFTPAGGGGGEFCTHPAQRCSSAAGPGAGLPAARPAGLRRYDFPGGGGGDDPAWPALGGLLRQGRVHGGQRRAYCRSGRTMHLNFLRKPCQSRRCSPSVEGCFAYPKPFSGHTVV